MIELRCAYCDRLLLEVDPGTDTAIRIRCRRCSALNRWSAEQPEQVELLESGREDRLPKHREPSEYK